MSTNILEKPTSTADANQKPLETFREGAVAASVWSRQSSTGHKYLEFSLSRSWKSKSGDKEGYSQNFFENNEEAIVKVITDACRFIRTVRPEHTVSDEKRELNMDEVETA